MKINIGRAAKAAALFIILVALDLFTKSLAVNALRDGKRIPLIPGVLEFYYIQNRAPPSACSKAAPLYSAWSPWPR